MGDAAEALPVPLLQMLLDSIDNEQRPKLQERLEAPAKRLRQENRTRGSSGEFHLRART